jgi:release factor glutamine methyltransferase
LWDETAATVGDVTQARWLCEVASACVERGEFDRRLDEPATVRMVAHLDSMVTRQRAGEPLQYVLGEWDFRRLTLAIDRRVLIPRPETELVAEAAIEKAAAFEPTRVVADLGTGSGAIGLSLARELSPRGTTVWLTDASVDALDVARANLAGIGPAATNVRVAHGSWFDALPDDTQFDVIVSNPPYVAEGSPDLEPVVGAWSRPRPFSQVPTASTTSGSSSRGHRLDSGSGAGWSSRSAPIRGRPSPSCCTRPGTTMSRSARTSPATTASQSAVVRSRRGCSAVGSQPKRTATAARRVPSVGDTS